MSAPRPSVRLLVCGTAERGDDGAALAAVARLLPALPETLRSRLEVRRCGQLDPLDLVELVVAHEGPSGAGAAEQRPTPVVLDTVIGVAPGSVVTMPLSDLAQEPVDAPHATPRSSHALPPDQVLRLAEAMAGRPVEGTFIGIGGHWFGYGGRFSRAVKHGLPAFEAAILFELERLAGPGDDDGETT
jgi:hydrogenase maturation protease